MRDHDISQRRTCQLIGVDPKTVRGERPPDSPEIRKEMKEIAGKRRRFGYRRIGILLERKGMTMNHKKLYRLYREEGLSVKRRRGRKRARGSRTPMPEAARPNARWSLDFLADSFGASRKFRILAVIDDCRQHNLCLIADTSRYCTLRSGNSLETRGVSSCWGAPQHELPILVFHGFATQPWRRTNGQAEGYGA
ncbi:insertion element IS2 transposase InsD [Jannaschia seosinensis]|uniref:Insertion element IS2 transposase InsD n=1 Tax=Jannaschia seosinensis TaxID=313367 RepID=A0A0M7BBU9_9RHOB|nr:insertion element IS2 transposase InsD [Jannaschia seosinensis]